MAYSPPRWLESVGEALLPPASAEHALGDLSECSNSNARYVENLVSVLPSVVWSQIRRRATLGGVAFNAVLTAFFLVVFQGIPKAPFFAEKWAWMRLAAPWAIWVMGCALAAAYGPRDKPTWWSRRVFLATVAATIGSAAVTGVPLVGVVVGLGVVFGTLLVLSMPWLTHRPPAPLSLETLPDHARLFQRGIWWRNARESMAAVVVVIVNARDLWQAENELLWTGHLLLIIGVLFIMGFLYFHAGSRTVPGQVDARTMLQFHRREVARQRDIIRAVPLWYLLPFMPGMAVMAVSRWQSAAGPALLGGLIVLGIFVLVWRLNVWAARWLDRKLQEVDALEQQL